MMYFDEMIGQNRTATPFSELSSTEEIAAKIETLTLDELEKQSAFMAKYPNPSYAVMRLQFLTGSEDEEHWKALLQMYEEKTLLSHLMETQEEAIRYLQTLKPKMMASFGLTEEQENEDPEYFKRAMNNLMSSLREIVIRDMIEV